MVHIMPHWNIEVFDGEPVPVVIYTNCTQVELRCNGKSLGCRETQPNTPLRWAVAYEPGKLEAIGYQDGVACAWDTAETAGEAKKLMLRLENDFQKPGDVALITCYAADDEGRLVPDACPEVTFCAGGDGMLIATGSDVTDHTPLSSPIRRMRAGLISVAVGVRVDKGSYLTGAGVIELYAGSPGLRSARLRIPFGKGKTPANL